MLYSKLLLWLTGILLTATLWAQEPETIFPFELRLEPMDIQGFPGLQSYAYAVDQGYWILVGGRTDGLHRRQPWASFHPNGQNKFIYVMDPVKGKLWKRALSDLPVSISDQLQSTNMGFIQKSGFLILTGGYGYSHKADDHRTFPYLTRIDVSGLIEAVKENKDWVHLFTQVRDPLFAITGGRMGSFSDTLFIAGGQRFDGLYNPHGPDHGPGFTQTYSNEIRYFQLNSYPDSPGIRFTHIQKDSLLLHRRDYNLAAQVTEKGQIYYTLFSGVFQYGKDIPFTNLVDVHGYTHREVPGFEQKFSHYHGANLPIFDEQSGTMHTLFLGGIAQFTADHTGHIKEDQSVPFTNQVSVISRNSRTNRESLLSIRMPGFTGASAECIPAIEAKLPGVDIIKAPTDNREILAGYIVGGISSDAPHIFWENTGKESRSYAGIIKVYIKRKQ